MDEFRASHNWHVVHKRRHVDILHFLVVRDYCTTYHHNYRPRQRLLHPFTSKILVSSHYFILYSQTLRSRQGCWLDDDKIPVL